MHHQRTSVDYCNSYWAEINYSLIILIKGENYHLSFIGSPLNARKISVGKDAKNDKIEDFFSNRGLPVSAIPELITLAASVLRSALHGTSSPRADCVI